MRDFLRTQGRRWGTAGVLVVGLSLVFFRLAIPSVEAGVRWGVAERNTWVVGTGNVDVRGGDTLRFRFYWSDGDVEAGHDKVKLHVCAQPRDSSLGGLTDLEPTTGDGGACKTPLVSSDLLSRIPTEGYTELSYKVARNTLPECNTGDKDSTCVVLFSFWICDQGAPAADTPNDFSRATCRNDRGDQSSLGLGTLTATALGSPTGDTGGITVNEDSSVVISLGASQANVTYEIQSQPSNGTLNLDAIGQGKVTYTPNGNYVGPDSFQYIVRGVSGSSPVATAGITVMPVNDAPRLTSYGIVSNGDPNPNPTTPFSSGNVVFQTSWIEIESDKVHIHICKTNKLKLNSEPTGGDCEEGQMLASERGPGNAGLPTTDSPKAVSYSIQPEDQGKTINYFVFVCDQASADKKCSPAQYNGGRFSVGSVTPRLNVTVNPPAGGRVTGGGIDCGNGGTICNIDMPTASPQVQLTAANASGYGAPSWSGCDSTSGAVCTVNTDATKNVTVTFAVSTFPLTVTAITGNGTVSASPISCVRNGAAPLDPDACSHDFSAGLTVPVSATPAAGYDFGSWGGDCSGNSCAPSMTAAKNISATFILKTYLLNVQVTGPGTVTSTTPAGVIDCRQGNIPDCSETFDFASPSTQVTLSAPAVPGYDFAWGGACSGNATTCTVTMDQARTVTASWTIGNFKLRVFRDGTAPSSPNNKVTIQNPAPALTCADSGATAFGTTCEKLAPFNTNITLVATKDAGAGMPTWTVRKRGGTPFPGAQPCTTASLTCTVTLTEDLDVAATFNVATQTLVVQRASTSSTGASGLITQITYSTAPQESNIPLTTATPSHTKNPVNFGTVVSITAQADTGWALTKWTLTGNVTAPDCGSTLPGVCTFTLQGNVTVDIEFKKTYTLEVIVHGSRADVSGAPEGLEDGLLISCNNDANAVPVAGNNCKNEYVESTGTQLNYANHSPAEFDRWEGDCVGGPETTCTPTINGNKVIHAYFNTPPTLTNITCDSPFSSCTVTEPIDGVATPFALTANGVADADQDPALTVGWTVPSYSGLSCAAPSGPQQSKLSCTMNLPPAQAVQSVGVIGTFQQNNFGAGDTPISFSTTPSVTGSNVAIVVFAHWRPNSDQTSPPEIFIKGPGETGNGSRDDIFRAARPTADFASSKPVSTVAWRKFGAASNATYTIGASISSGSLRNVTLQVIAYKNVADVKFPTGAWGNSGSSHVTSVAGGMPTGSMVVGSIARSGANNPTVTAVPITATPFPAFSISPGNSSGLLAIGLEHAGFSGPQSFGYTGTMTTQEWSAVAVQIHPQSNQVDLTFKAKAVDSFGAESTPEASRVVQIRP